MSEKLTLTGKRIQILTAMRDEPPLNTDGWTTANWIAETCDHYYDSAWAGSQLPALVKAGFAERGERGWYRITDAGRRALEALLPKDTP